MILATKLGDRTIPNIGLGLWQIQDKADLERSVTAALQAGYRHFDTAQAYGNEKMLGDILSAQSISRSQLFITTKISVKNFGAHATNRSFKQSLEALKTDYVDLLLLHFPVTGLRKRSWQALEKLHAAGQARAVGVSNYTIRHLEQMKKYASVMPAVNQVELHVFLQQPDLLEYCQQEGIVVEAYSPLAHGHGLNDSMLVTLAEKYKKTPAQIMLRWCLQVGTILLPKSVTPERVAQNIAIFDFELTGNDMQKIKRLNKNLRTCWDPTRVP